jgi:hypothetical protein
MENAQRLVVLDASVRAVEIGFLAARAFYAEHLFDAALGRPRAGIPTEQDIAAARELASEIPPPGTT